MAHSSALFLGVLAALCLSAQGVQYVWNGTGGGNISTWEDPTQWIPNTGYPNSTADSAIINSTQANVNWGANGQGGQVASLVLGSGATLNIMPIDIGPNTPVHIATTTTIAQNSSISVSGATYVATTITLTETAIFELETAWFNSTTATTTINVANFAQMVIANGSSYSSVALQMTGGTFNAGGGVVLPALSGVIAGINNWIDGVTINGGQLQIAANASLLINGACQLANMTISAPSSTIEFSANSSYSQGGNTAVTLYDSTSIQAQTIIIDGTLSNTIQCDTSIPDGACKAKLTGTTLQVVANAGTNTAGNQVQIAPCFSVTQTNVAATYFGSVAFNPGAQTGPLNGNFTLDIGTTGIACDSVSSQSFNLTNFSGTVTSQAPLLVGPHVDLSLLNLEQAINNTYSVSFVAEDTSVKYLKWMDVQSTAVFIPPSAVVMSGGSMPGPNNTTLPFPPTNINHAAHYAQTILKVAPSPTGTSIGLESVFVQTAMVDFSKVRRLTRRFDAVPPATGPVPLGWTAMTFTPNSAGDPTIFNSTHDDQLDPALPSATQWAFFTFCQPGCVTANTCPGTVNQLVVYNNQTEWRASAASGQAARPCEVILEPGHFTTVGIDNLYNFAYLTVGTDPSNRKQVQLNMGDGTIMGDIAIYNSTLTTPQQVNISGSLLLFGTTLMNDTTYNFVNNGATIRVSGSTLAPGADDILFFADPGLVAKGTCFEIWTDTKGAVYTLCKNDTLTIKPSDYPNGFMLTFSSPTPPAAPPGPRPGHSGAIAGAIIGTVVALVVVGGVVFLVIRRRRAGYTGVGEKGTNL